MSAKFKGQQQWVQEVLGKFGDLQESQPEPYGGDPQWPEWVSNLFVTFIDITYPGVKIKNQKNWKAKDLGRFLGRHYAGECLVQGRVPLSLQVVREGERFSTWAEKWVKHKRPDLDIDKFHKKYEQESKAWKPILIKFMQETLASACQRPYLEASAFFEAFGKAIVIKPDDFLTERTMGVGDKICWAMFVMWREIDQLQSIGQLHRLLEEALKPKGLVVKYKRIEKLCQRIKLKFKGPGRPPGSKTQTNPTSV
ncbi:MAG TPA: hypothetical protein VGO59_00760 [Verrucomicrobiae bacterium]|jgi:hypothetical protein